MGAPTDGRGARGLGMALLLVALVSAGGRMVGDLDGDWSRGWLGHNGARYSQIARNYARDGFLRAGGAPRFDTLGADPAQPEVYAHHPPGVTLLVGAVFRMVGVSERAARRVSEAATLLGLVLLGWLVSRARGPLAGGMAALFTASFPMTIVFGTHVEVQGPHVLAAGLAVLLGYDHGRRGGRWWPWVVAVLVASAFDWFGLYYAAGCAAHALLAGPRRPRLALALGAWVAAVFAAWVLWLGNLPGMTPARVFSAASVRVGGGEGAELAGQPTLAEALLARWDSLGDLLPFLPLLLVVTLAVLLVPRLSTALRGAAPAASEESAGAAQAGAAASGALGPRGMLGLLLAPPLVHCLLFPAGLAVHNYWLFALPPALGTALALALARVPRVGRTALGHVAAAMLLSGALSGFAPWFGSSASLDAAREPVDALPAMVGRALADEVPVGGVVLTNFPTNPLRPGEAGDTYHVRLPEVTFYADRPVRGGIGDPAALDEALARRPDASWFLLMPASLASSATPGQQPLLEAALERLAVGPPRLLSGDPPVRLYTLAR